MARNTDDAKLSTPTARARLAARREPYFRGLQRGLALGYRRGQRGGTWLARIRLPEAAGYVEVRIGTADDAGGAAAAATVLSYDRAVAAARDAFAQAEARRVSGTLPAAGKAALGDVLDLYREAYRAGETGRRPEPGRDLANVDSILKCHLRSGLGAIRLDLLSEERLKAFRRGLVEAPRLSRSGKPVPFDRDADDFDEGEALRKRRARANRVMTVLRAALNHALREKWFASDAAWRQALKPHPNADVASVRWLEIAECEALKAVVDPDFRDLVRGALQTGCRYGSLRHLACRDVDLRAATATVRVTKSGDTQVVHLKPEGCRLLSSLMKGKPRSEFVFLKADGSQWKPSDQQRRMEQGCRTAGINPAVTFHELRDTFASHLVMAGVPLLTVSKLLGHRDVRTTEKYYAHLAPSHLKQAIKKLPEF